MIKISTFKDKKIALFGLGGSGLATALACQEGGAEVIVWDDSENACHKAKEKGLIVQDLHDIDWQEISALVLTPGVALYYPKPHWSVELARQNNVEIIGDIELFVRERNAFLTRHPGENLCPFIAITGTNGKSTTTALVAHLLEIAGFSVEMGGNIGKPVLKMDSFLPTRRQAYVIEISSYQIDLAPSINPDIGILLNITPDHIDRHGSFGNYARVKERLVEKSKTAIVATDENVPCQTIYKHLKDAGQKVIRVSSMDTANMQMPIALRGPHNRQNAAAAIAAGKALGLQYFKTGIASFDGLPHRMEQVGHYRHNGVTIRFVNDSKATNADAVLPALKSFWNIYWLAGGRAKEGGIKSLLSVTALGQVKKAFFFGEAAPEFSKAMENFIANYVGSNPTTDRRSFYPNSQYQTMKESVIAAFEQAKADIDAHKTDIQQNGGEITILLAPAGSSFDAFKNFEKRGEVFAELVKSLCS